jgi:hypothetical protein
MSSVSKEQSIRLALGTALNICLWPLVMQSAKWRSFDREAYLTIIEGGVAAAALVSVKPLFWRGRPWQVPIAFVLLWLPSVELYNIVLLLIDR